MASLQRHLTCKTAWSRIARPRLEDRLARGNSSAITVLVGPAGCGKSDIVRAALGGAGSVYFRAGNEPATLAGFVHGLARAIGIVAPGAPAMFTRAWERSLESRSPAVALAHWLCEQLAGIDSDLVIDELHAGVNDPSIISFISEIADQRCTSRLILAVRDVGALPIALWMATRRMQSTIGQGEMAFERGEIAQAAKQLGLSVDARTFKRVGAATNGLAVAVMYALTRLRDDGDGSSKLPIPASFDDVASQIFDRQIACAKDYLLSAALVTGGQDPSVRWCGWDGSQATCLTAGSDAPFVWETDERGSFRFHGRFRDFLARRFETHDADYRSSVAVRTVNALAVAGRHADALEVATHQRLRAAAGELLDAYGFEILESGEADVIKDALGAFENTGSGATGLALRGYIEARAGHLDTAEAWFRLSLDAAPDEASRATIALYYARELTKRRRHDACLVLEEFTASTSLPRSLLVDVRSAYARALIMARRFDEARAHSDAALELLDARSSPAQRARVFERAAFVAHESGETELARRRALVAAPLAAAHALYEVAASAYGILYIIAYDVDDDVAAAWTYVRLQRDMAVKCGILRAELFGAVAMYELHAEAGDDAALADLDSQLAKIDQHDATIGLLEVMMPLQALRAGWSGEFNAAQRLLSPAAERQGTAVRTALCWAQVALYRAAAGDSVSALEAAAAAETQLQRLERHELGTMQHGLTLLHLALAALASNDVERARHWTNVADDAVVGHAPRLRALRSAIGAMIAGWDDEEGFAAGVPPSLAALRNVSFGGMARLIEALPSRFSDAIAPSPTIASFLARAELRQRFAAAVQSENGSLAAWLNGVQFSTYCNLAIANRFEQWVSENGSFQRGAQAGIWNVRRELAAYRRPAPAIVGLVDGVDAALAALFDQLDAASPLMAEHCRAVAAWCTRLGRALGLSESEITFATRCGLIHDIGKVRTPAEILEAPRRLTPPEWDIMRAHTTEGAMLVERIPILIPFMPVVRGHHERLDGKGYPDGLQAKDISMAARIVAVADCFNAMIGRRPYRAAMPPTEALAELERHRETQFDPEVVEAMVRIVCAQVVESQAASSPGSGATIASA